MNFRIIEQLWAKEAQQQSQDDMSKLLDTIRKMAMAMARLEKRLVEAKSPIEASKPERVPPPLPLLA